MSISEGMNPRQMEAVEYTEGPLLILAGAGSGKTRVLTHRIAYLIEEKHVPAYQIMAITFTNKAAHEMRERVDRIVSFGQSRSGSARFIPAACGFCGGMRTVSDTGTILRSMIRTIPKP